MLRKVPHSVQSHCATTRSRCRVRMARGRHGIDARPCLEATPDAANAKGQRAKVSSQDRSPLLGCGTLLRSGGQFGHRVALELLKLRQYVRHACLPSYH
jgi:hypothetical protein